MKTFLIELYKRALAEVPSFFKKLRALGLSLAMFGTTLQTIPNLPANLLAIGVQLIWVGGVIAAMAQITVSNPDELKK